MDLRRRIALMKVIDDVQCCNHIADLIQFDHLYGLEINLLITPELDPSAQRPRAQI